MERLSLRLTGRVQGVGLRYEVATRALALGLVGYVKNERDGNVSIVAEGETGALQALLSWLQGNERSGDVVGMDVRWLASRNDFTSFEVRW